MTVLVLVLVLGVVDVVVVDGVVDVLDGSVVVVGGADSVTVSVGTGATASDVVVAVDVGVVVVDDVVVAVSDGEESPDIKLIKAHAMRAKTMTPPAPIANKPAGLRYHGSSGGGS